MIESERSSSRVSRLFEVVDCEDVAWTFSIVNRDNFFELFAIEGVSCAHEILDGLPFIVPAVSVVLDIMVCTHLLRLVDVEVPCDLIVLLCNSIHDSLE